MPRTKIYLAAGLLLAVFAIAVIWQPQGSEPVKSTPEEEPVAQQPAQAAPVEANLGVVRSITDEPALAISEASSKSKLPLEPAYHEDDAVLISGLDSHNDQPIADADVYVLSELDFYKARQSLQPDTDERHMIFILRDKGKRYRSGEDGVARIPPPEADLVVAIEKGERIGVGSGLKLGMKEFSLPMRPRNPLTATVHDVSGNPVVGVPVSIRYSYHSRRYTASTRRTDVNGEAHFYSVSMLTQARGGPPKFAARLEIPGSVAVNGATKETELSDEVLASGSVHFTLPTTGGVRVHVLDHQGNPFHGDGIVTLAETKTKSGAGGSHKIMRSIVAGTAEFPFVGLGEKLEAKFRAADSKNDDVISIETPINAGDWVDASIQVSNWPVLTGLILDPDQNPLAETVCKLEFVIQEEGQSREQQVSGSTNAAGEFRLEPYRAELLLAAKSWTCTVTAKSKNGFPCHAELSSSTPFQYGDNSLGTIELSHTRMLLTGRVVDEQGGVVPGAKLEMRGPGVSRRSGTSISFNGKSSPRLPTIEAESNAHGEFELYGDVPEADGYQVVIQAKGFQETKQDVILGMEGVDLVVHQAGKIVGSVLLDDGVPPQRMTFRLRAAGAKYSHFDLKQTSEKNRYDLYAEVQVGKTYRLTVNPWGGEKIYELDSLVALQGEELRPPQLQPLDLRGMLLPIRIAAKDQDGTSLKGQFRILRDRGSSGSSFGEEGSVILAPIGGIPRLQLEVKGFKSVELQNVTTDQLVTMEKSIECRLRIPANLAHYRAKQLTWALLDEQENAFITRGRFDSEGRATLYLPHLGDFRLRLNLLSQSEGFGFSREFGDYRPISFHNSGQEVFVDIDQAELDAAIDELDKD